MNLRRLLVVVPALLAGCTVPALTPGAPTTGRPSDTLLYVFDGLGKTIDEVDLATRQVTLGVMKTGLYPNQFAVTPDGTYLVNSGDADLVKLDLRHHATLSTFNLPVGSNPMTLASLSPGHGVVVDYLGKDVAWVDLGKQAVEATVSVPVGAPGGGLAIANGKAYVAAVQADYSQYPKIAFQASVVDVFDVATHALLKTIALSATDNPSDLAVDPIGDVEVCTAQGVDVIDPAKDQVVRTATFGATTHSVAFASTTRAYALSTGGVVSFDPTTGSVVRDVQHAIPAGDGTLRIHRGAAYVANFASGSIRVIDLATETASGSDLAVGSGPQDMTFVDVP